MRKLWEMSKVKIGEESIKSMKSHTQDAGYSKCVHMRTSGRGQRGRGEMGREG